MHTLSLDDRGVSSETLAGLESEIDALCASLYRQDDLPASPDIAARLRHLFSVNDP